ncbi:hypothetical protein D3C81_1040300 [compost metagenome]
MGKAQQATEAQLGKTWIERAHRLVKLSQYLFPAWHARMVFEQRLQGRPDTGIPIDQDFVAIDQQCTIISQVHGV